MNRFTLHLRLSLILGLTACHVYGQSDGPVKRGSAQPAPHVKESQPPPGPLADVREAFADGTPLVIDGILRSDDPRHADLKTLHRNHAIRLRKALTYQFNLSSKAFDTIMALEDASGRRLATDAGSGSRAQIVFKAPKDDVYRVVVASWEDKVGNYTLRVGSVTKVSQAFADVDAAFQKSVDEVKTKLQQAKSQEETDKLMEQYMLPVIERWARVSKEYANEHSTIQGMHSAPVVLRLLWSSRSSALACALRTFISNSSDKDAQGLATITLGRILVNRYESAFQENRKEAPELYREAEKTLAEMLERLDENSPFANRLNDALFELRNLSVGRPAPDIDAEDVDGKRLKLSDYRGKVVVLVFWGGFCPPCMAMIPHERELVARMKERPFALLGVNGDEEREQVRKLVKDKDINWRSFWNGGPRGAISTEWRIHGWPTIYVLDGSGIIRFRDIHGDDLDRAVGSLLADLESGTKVSSVETAIPRVPEIDPEQVDRGNTAPHPAESPASTPGGASVKPASSPNDAAPRAAARAPAGAESELAKWQGRWRLASAEIDGQEQKRDEVSTQSIIVSGSGLKIAVGRFRQVKGVLELGSSPRGTNAFSFQTHGDKLAQRGELPIPRRGIYEFREGKLVVCFSHSCSNDTPEHPNEFKTSPEPELHYYTFDRVPEPNPLGHGLEDAHRD